MSRRFAQAILATLAVGGLAAVIGATALGTRSPYFGAIIAAGVDGVTIGVAGLILLLIFSNKKPPPRAFELRPAPRSLEQSQAHELKVALIQNLSRENPVNILFPANDSEAEDFARQIARFLSDNRYRIGELAAQLPIGNPMPGVGVGDNNEIMVGPLRAAAPPPP